MENKKKVVDYRLEVRLQGLDSELARRLIEVAKHTGIDASRVAILAIRVGLPNVKENLEGLVIDMDEAAFSLTNASEARRRELERG
jgi:hypothetical protein